VKVLETLFVFRLTRATRAWRAEDKGTETLITVSKTMICGGGAGGFQRRERKERTGRHEGKAKILCNVLERRGN